MQTLPKGKPNTSATISKFGEQSNQESSRVNLHQISTSSSKKMYVPITPINQNHHQTPTNPTKNRDDSSLHLQIEKLKRQNNEIRQKQEIYIDKLMKLEEGLEKQHKEYLHLQDIYTQLFTSYKQKEGEVAQLELLYRETNRKRQLSSNQNSNNPQNIKQQTLKSNTEQLEKLEKQNRLKDQKIKNLNNQIDGFERTIRDLQETANKMRIQINYHKSKEKMMDSRASLHSKVFEELEQWQRAVDTEKQQKIKVQYENQFLKNRNQDLQKRVKQLQEIVKNRQAQISKLRQSNILLHRQNSQSKLSKSRQRSTSRSPNKRNSFNSSVSHPRNNTYDSKNNTQPLSFSSEKMVSNAGNSQLIEENKDLKEEIEKLKNLLSQLLVRQKNYNSNSDSANHQNPQQKFIVKQQQFFSFSHEGQGNTVIEQSLKNRKTQTLSNYEYSIFRKNDNVQSSRGLMSERSITDSLQDKKSHRITYEDFSQAETPKKVHEYENDEKKSPARFASPKQHRENIYIASDQLDDLPPALEIENLIKSRQKQEKTNELTNSDI